MSSTFLEIIVIFVLTVANGVFAMSEAALISSRKARLQQRANEGDARARAALKLAHDPHGFLATVQIGITLIGILLGAFGSATIAKPLADLLRSIPFLAAQADGLAFGIVVILTTYVSLIIGELVPKQLALNNPERIASAVAGPMSILSRISLPLVRLLSVSSHFVLRLLNVRASDEPGVTEEEIKVMIEQGTQAGTFAEAERDLVGRVFKLDDLRVGAIMMPRTGVIWLDINDPVEELRQQIRTTGKARYPVADGSLDKVIGVVRAKDLLARILDGQPFDLRACMKEPLFVPGSVSALNALKLFQEAKLHMALVLDEYGGLAGIVTLADVMARIIGESTFAGGYDEPRVVQREDGSLLLDGLMSVDEVKEVLQLKALPGEEAGDYQTLGGFIMSQMGRIPAAADKLEVAGITFEVIDMDGHRVDKVLVIPEAPPQSEAIDL